MSAETFEQVGTASDGNGIDRRVAAIADWLNTPVAADPKDDLDPLLAKLATLGALPVPAAQLQRVLDPLQSRAQALARALKPRLAEARLPLEPQLRQTAKKLMDIHGLLAGGYQRVLDELQLRAARNSRINPALVAGHALRSIAERLQTAALIASPSPPGAWRHAHTLYRNVGSAGATTAGEAEQSVDPASIYKQMLALAIIQPDRLTAEELMFAVEYLAHFAPVIELHSGAQGEPDQRSYWVEQQGDAGPCAVIRRPPPESASALLISCLRLGSLAAEQLRWLEGGATPDKLHLPAQAVQARFRALLQRMQESWTEPRSRLLHRRRNSYSLQVCTGLTAVWKLLLADGEDAPMPALSNWIVVNESPTGYALSRVAGQVDGLVNGGVIAVRAVEDKPWDICIVRWLHTDDNGQIELGVQIVAAGATPVHVAFRNPQRRDPPQSGLLLPAISALRSHEAILAPAGCCSSRRFVIVSGGRRTHVVQGRMLSLDIQTMSVELFQFQPDPYPI